MGAIDKDQHRPWLAYALEESLEHALLTPRDVIDHANPEVLVTQLPPSVISVLLSKALSIGTFSAAQVLASAPPALLAEHLNPEVMWRCLTDAADRGGLSRTGGARTERSKQWFASVLSRALESQFVTPADVLRFLPPSEFVNAAPRPVLAELIKEALSRSSIDAELVLNHLTPMVIAESLETSLVWACIQEAAARHFELGATAPKHAAAGPTKTAAVAPLAAPAVKPVAAAKPAESRVPSPGMVDEKTPAPVPMAGASSPAPKASNGVSMSARPGAAAAVRAPAAAPVAVMSMPTARHDGGE